MAIKHVIVLMLENRSFDHLLGDQPGVNGIDRAHPRSNSYDGRDYLQAPGAGRNVCPDPRHEWDHVTRQIAGNNGGFVYDYASSYPHAGPMQYQEVMSYHQRGSLPALHTLADHFTVCDHWYAPVPGPTWPNRLFAMSGTSLGRVTMPEGPFSWNLHWYNQYTIFDRLNEVGEKWKVYYGDFPLSFLLVNQWKPNNVACHHPMTQFFFDVRQPAATFPAFAFIEPQYFSPGADDDHPPHDTYSGDVLIKDVYNAIRKNDALWNETLLVVLFDEHGGFYDHEPPIAAVAPDANHGDNFDFTKTGLRVPALLVSPFAAQRVISTPFDHTSLLKYLIDKWDLGPLYNRTAHANSIASALLPAARTDATPAVIDIEPQPALEAPADCDRLSRNQSAIVALSHALETTIDEDIGTVAARSKYMLSNAQSQVDVAVERVESFIANLAAKATKIVNP
ncbi:MAG TPA: alkaline phosphatase family protein [Candidatus Binataceae bacterium]|nr:alkaline phosphatase family protein [Candidatus Binataceae bacterium]